MVESHEHLKISASLRSCDRHSAFVTNTAFFTPFLCPSTPFLWPAVAALYKERKGEKKLSGCTRDQEYKAASFMEFPHRTSKAHGCKHPTRDFLSLIAGASKETRPDSGQSSLRSLDPVVDIGCGNLGVASNSLRDIQQPSQRP
jgi:hypothetical protein